MDDDSKCMDDHSKSMDDQRMVRSVTTRHLDALRDLQKSENDRLQRIKNDPSRQLSRHHSVDTAQLGIGIGGGIGGGGVKESEDSLPVKQLWDVALIASKLTVENRVADTRRERDLLAHCLSLGLGTGYVRSKIGLWEKLIVLSEATSEQVDTTILAGYRRMTQMASTPNKATMYVFPTNYCHEIPLS